MQSAIEIIHAPPPSSSFVPLAQHQAQTPASFYDGPAVLYHQATGCKLVASKRDLRLLSLIKDAGGGGGGDANAEGEDAEGNEKMTLDGVDAWVTSRRLYIYLNSLSSGVAVPYPAISLHAVQRIPGASEGDEMVKGLYMQLSYTQGSSNGDGMDQEDEDDIFESVTMTIIPPSPTAAVETTTATKTTSDSNGTEKHASPTDALYAALSACADLHPDPTPEDNDGDNDDGDAAIPNFPIYNMPPSTSLADSHLYQAGLVQQGAMTGLPPPMPGSGGWITAENLHEYFDEDGNWKGKDGVRDEPSVGAGMKRAGDDGKEDADEEEETKWRKTGE